MPREFKKAIAPGSNLPIVAPCEQFTSSAKIFKTGFVLICAVFDKGMFLLRSFALFFTVFFFHLNSSQKIDATFAVSNRMIASVGITLIISMINNKLDIGLLLLFGFG